MSVIDLVVRRRRTECEGVCSFDLEAEDGSELPPFTAGAHVDVHLGEGLIRQYSLCNNPAERHRYRIAVLREPTSRGGSATMHDRVMDGSRLKVGLPRNLFPAETDRPALLIAGGIGITPLLAMAYALFSRGTPWRMHCSARTSSRQPFRQEIEEQRFASAVQFHTDDGSGGGPFEAQTAIGIPRGSEHLYVCGPAGFMNHVLATARDLGWPQDRLHREYFAPGEITSVADGSFTLKLSRTGRQLLVPAEKSALQVLLEAGIDVPYACESGVCGTCLTPVLEGIPDHRDSFLTEHERTANSQFTPCCSRACGDNLVINL